MRRVDIDWIHEQIKDIASIKDNHQEAFYRERHLHESVLSEIASSLDCPNPQELAKACLKSKWIEFPRFFMDRIKDFRVDKE